MLSLDVMIIEGDVLYLLAFDFLDVHVVVRMQIGGIVSSLTLCQTALVASDVYNYFFKRISKPTRILSN